jgi:hypothetical protein
MMIRNGWFVLALALSGAGCITFPTWDSKPAPRVAAEQEVMPPAMLPMVTADQITQSNAAQMVGALKEEMDRSAREDAAIPDSPPVERKSKK